MEAAVAVVKTNLAGHIEAFEAHPHEVPGKDTI
jgi:hypothetical protein